MSVHRSNVYLESTLSEQQGLLPEECIRVRQIMTSSVAVVSPMTTVVEVVALMKSLAVGVVIVLDGPTLIGTLSDRDLALASPDKPSTPISQIMSRTSLACADEDFVGEALATMRAHGLTALAVRNSCGLISGALARSAAEAAVRGRQGS